MDVKEAARTAKNYLVSLYDDEEIMNVGLEEVVFEETSNRWRITIGFSRHWDQKGILTTALGEGRPARSYKVLCIDDVDSQVKSLTDRVLPDLKS